MISQWILENTWLIYITPTVVFLGKSLVWFLKGRVQSTPVAWRSGWIPVLSVYGAFGVLLYSGGLHRILHLRLEGVEMTTEQGGETREFIVGGWGNDGEEPTLFVKDYPAQALTMSVEDGQATLRPGPGYDRRLLVVNGETLVPLEGDVPALIPLQEGDEIVVEPRAGGGEVVRKILGNDFSDFTPMRDGSVRWIGGKGTGVEMAAGYPAEVVGVRLLGPNRLELLRGAGLKSGVRVLFNGRDTGLHQQAKMEIPYLPGEARLELRKLDPLAGKLVYQKESLRWEGEARRFGLRIRSGQVWTLGGDAFDDIYVKGLPAGALSLSVGADGVLVQNTKDLEGVEQEKVLAAGRGWAIGVKSERPWGGILSVNSLRIIPLGEEPVPGAEEVLVAELYEAEINWVPNSKTRMDLPRRLTTLPVVGKEVELWTNLPWTDRVYPLSNCRSVESGLRSCVVHGAMKMSKNESALLVMEPGVKVLRGGKEVKAVKTGKPGVLTDGEKVEFRVLSTLVQPGPEGAIRTSLQPREVVEPRRVLTRKTLSSLNLLKDEGGKAIGIQAMLDEPEVEAIDLSAIERDNRNVEELKDRIAFGVNDNSDWAALPHQVRFQAITDWFDSASGEVETKGTEFVMHDDFRRETKKYGETFTIGGKDRLVLTAQKRTVPIKKILWLAVAALVCIATARWWASTFAGSALFFAVAFLTGSRVLFRQAVAVNYPFDEETIPFTLLAAIVLPISLLIVLKFGKPVTEFLMKVGRKVFAIGPLQKVPAFLPKGYTGYSLLALALLIVRIGFLMLGMKEAVMLGGIRFALSIFFVPAYLLLFAIGLTRGMSQLSETMPRREMWGFLSFCGSLMFCQAVSGLLVSDLGTFLYAIPPALVLFLIGAWMLFRSLRSRGPGKEVIEALGILLIPLLGLRLLFGILGGGLGISVYVISFILLILLFGFGRFFRNLRGMISCRDLIAAGGLLLYPLLGIILVLTFPKALVQIVDPSLESKLLEQGEIVTDSTLLRVLHFADENFLVNLGTDASERILQDHAIIENYAQRGLRGEGYLQVEVIPLKKETALNDNVSAVYIFGQFGVLGAGAVCLAYMGILLSTFGSGMTTGDWIARLMAMSFVFTSVYMLAANWGLTPFTGRNMYLLGLDSNGDLLESAVLLGLLVLGRSLGSGGKTENGLMGALLSK